MDRKTRNHLLLGIGLVLLTQPIAEVSAQKKVSVRNVQGEADITRKTPEDACAEAMCRACAEAVAQRGIEVKSSIWYYMSESYSSAKQLREANEAFLELVQTFSRGWVSDVRNKRWHVKNLEPDSAKLPKLVVEVTLDADVIECAGIRDPEFEVEIHTNQPVYRDKAAIDLRIIPTKDCYITLFSFDSDSVRLLVPPWYAPDNWAQAHSVFKIPGIVKASLPKGWSEASELMFVVATTNRTSFLQGRLERTFSMTREGAMMTIGMDCTPCVRQKF